MPPGFREAYRAYVEGGWGTLAGPAEYGGQGLPLTPRHRGDGGSRLGQYGLLAVHDADARRGRGAASITARPSCRQAWLPKLVTGEWTGTMNLTEPQAGSDVGALKTRAEPAGDGSYRITGQKIFITFGEHDLADNIVHLVLARTAGRAAGDARASRCSWCPRSCPTARRNDLRCVSIEHKLGIHASPTCVMAYGDEGDCRSAG